MSPVELRPLDADPDAVNHVALRGSLTVYEAADSKRLLLEALARPGELVVDLSELDEIDTAGVQLLVLLHREASATGKTLRLRPPGDVFEAAIETLGLASHFRAALEYPR